MAKLENRLTPSLVRYMVVDDHPGFRDIIMSFLPQGSRDVRECSNGEEALKEFQAWQPDWVLMDIEMPVMNGFDAALEIMRRDPKAHVVMITQHDSPELRKKARECGVCGFLSKADLEELEPLLVRLNETESNFMRE